MLVLPLPLILALTVGVLTYGAREEENPAAHLVCTVTGGAPAGKWIVALRTGTCQMLVSGQWLVELGAPYSPYGRARRAGMSSAMRILSCQRQPVPHSHAADMGRKCGAQKIGLNRPRHFLARELSASSTSQRHPSES